MNVYIIYYLLLSKNATYKYTYNFMFNKNKKYLYHSQCIT